MKEIITEAAENLQLYFSLGKNSFLEDFNTISNKYFIEKEQFDVNVNFELEKMKVKNVRLDFINLCHRIYKKDGIPHSYRHGVIRCESIICRVYNIKN